MIELADIEAAARRLQGVAHRTPVITSRTLDERGTARSISRPRTCSASARSSSAAPTTRSRCPAEDRRRGVLVRQPRAGGRARGRPARRDRHDPDAGGRPAAKLAATRGYGAEVVTSDRYAEDRNALLAGARRGAAADARAAVRAPARHGRPGHRRARALEEPGRSTRCWSRSAAAGCRGCATVAKALYAGHEHHRVEPEAGDDTRRSLDAGRAGRHRRCRARSPTACRRQSPASSRSRSSGALADDDRDRLRRRARRRDALRVRAPEAGRRAERRPRARRAARGQVELATGGVGAVISGGNVGVERFRELRGPRPGTETFVTVAWLRDVSVPTRAPWLGQAVAGLPRTIADTFVTVAWLRDWAVCGPGY